MLIKKLSIVFLVFLVSFLFFYVAELNTEIKRQNKEIEEINESVVIMKSQVMYLMLRSGGLIPIDPIDPEDSALFEH